MKYTSEYRPDCASAPAKQRNMPREDIQVPFIAPRATPTNDRNNDAQQHHHHCKSTQPAAVQNDDSRFQNVRPSLPVPQVHKTVRNNIDSTRTRNCSIRQYHFIFDMIGDDYMFLFVMNQMQMFGKKRITLPLYSNRVFSVFVIDQ